MADQDLHPTPDAPTTTDEAPDGQAPPPSPPPAPSHPGRPIPRTRLGGAWIALTAGAVVLLLLLIFILENSQSVDIAFFGAHGHLPLGVALLLAAIAGIVLVMIPVVGRIYQLRRVAKRHRSALVEAERQAASPQQSA